MLPKELQTEPPQTQAPGHGCAKKTKKEGKGGRKRQRVKEKKETNNSGK